MNNYDGIMLIAFVLGQLGYASVSVYIIQNKIANVSYWEAMRQYFKKEVGSFVMAACGWAIVMFIASDWVDVTVTKKDLLVKESLTIKDKLIIYQRSIATGLGAFIQHIIYVAFKRGKKAIHDYAQKNNVDDNIKP